MFQCLNAFYRKCKNMQNKILCLSLSFKKQICVLFKTFAIKIKENANVIVPNITVNK